MAHSRIAVSSIKARVSQSFIDWQSLTVKSLKVESLTSAPIESTVLRVPSTKDSERFADSGHIAFASLYLSSKIDCPHSPPTMFSDETGSRVCNDPAQLSISVTSLDNSSSFESGFYWGCSRYRSLYLMACNTLELEIRSSIGSYFGTHEDSN